MNTTAKILLAIGLVGVFSGCTLTKCNLTGTEGGTVKGYHRMTASRDEDTGTVPYMWCTCTLWLGEWNRLEECEYRKASTNDLLLLKVRTRGFKGQVSSPPGTSGVRVVREGDTYRKETF